jgi:hypothetical protein
MPEKRDTVVFIFGAVATKACGGPLTNEILPDAFWTHPSGLPQSEIVNREDYLAVAREFLECNFPLFATPNPKPADFPGLSLLLSLIDNPLDRKEPFGGREGDDLATVRSAFECLIFALLEFRLAPFSLGTACPKTTSKCFICSSALETGGAVDIGNFGGSHPNGDETTNGCAGLHSVAPRLPHHS